MSWNDKASSNLINLPLQAGESLCEIIDEEAKNLCVVESLPELLQKADLTCIQNVIPKVNLALPNASKEFHLAASNSFLTILEKNLVNTKTFTQTFLQSILASIDSKDPVVANAWFETLLDVIDLLPCDVIKNEILPVALTKGQLCHSITDRITACKLIGKIATRIDPTQIKQELVPIVFSLCQDVHPEVRRCICSQLPLIARPILDENAKPSLLPSLVELASDEDSLVRATSIEAIVELIPLVKSEILLHTIIPLVIKICEQSIRAVDNVLVVLSFQFGKLALGLMYTLSRSEKNWITQFYYDLSQIGLPQSRIKVENEIDNMERLVQVRRNCAYNLSAMTIFTLAGGGASILERTFRELAADPSEIVRRTVALSTVEVAELFGSRCTALQPAIVGLLLDDVEEVLESLVSLLGKIMHFLTCSGAFSPHVVNLSTLDFVKALIKCESEISNTYNWRLEELLLKQFEVLPTCFHSDIIYIYFVPIFIFRILKSRPLPIKLAAARCLLICLRYNNSRCRRLAIRDKIITTLCHNSSFYIRSVFIRTMKVAMELFSFQYFKNNFFIHLMKYADDKVPNIRLMFVDLLPQLKSMMRLPSDKKLLLALEASVKSLVSNEKDKDVTEKLTRVIQQLTEVEVLADNSPPTLALLEDERKLKEEILIETTSIEIDNTDSLEQKLTSDFNITKEAEINTTSLLVSPITLRKSRNQPKLRKRYSHLVTTSFSESISSSSMVDEFYVDAGVRLNAPGVSSIPTKIPNLKEIFKISNVSEKKKIIKSEDSTNDTFSYDKNNSNNRRNFLTPNIEKTSKTKSGIVNFYENESELKTLRKTVEPNVFGNLNRDAQSFSLDNKNNHDYNKIIEKTNEIYKKSIKVDSCENKRDEKSTKKVIKNSLIPELSTKDTRNDMHLSYLNEISISHERKSNSRPLSMIETKIASITFNQDTKNNYRKIDLSEKKKELIPRLKDNRRYSIIVESKPKDKQDMTHYTKEISKIKNDNKQFTNENKEKNEGNDFSTETNSLEHEENDYGIVLRTSKSYIPLYKRSSVGSASSSSGISSGHCSRPESPWDSDKRLSLGSLMSIKSNSLTSTSLGESKLPIRKKK